MSHSIAQEVMISRSWMLSAPAAAVPGQSVCRDCLQAIGARKLAVEEVERLLQSPEALQRLASLREEYAQKQQVRGRAAASPGLY